MDNFQMEEGCLSALKAESHTSARGTEAFDKIYGLGYEVGVIAQKP